MLCVCNFYIFSYCCWFVGTPCHPPGPDWSHVWSMFVPFLFDYWFGTPFLDRCLQTTFLLSTDRKTAKICQNLPRSNEELAGISLQAQLAETEHKNAKLPNEGAAVSRRMASSIRSRPEGARGVFKRKVTFPIFYFSIDVLFSLGRSPQKDLWNWSVPGGVRRDAVAPSFSLVSTFFTSNVVNNLGIDFHGFCIICWKVFS